MGRSHTLRLTGWRSWVGIAFLSVMIIACLVTAFMPAPAGQPGLPLVAGICVPVFGAMAAYCVALRQRYRVTFHPDAVEIATVFRNRRVMKSDVASWLHAGSNSDWPTAISLVLKDGGRSIELPLADAKHPAVSEWFADIPNAETQWAADSMSELLKDPRYGPSSEQRLATLKRERRIASALSFIGLGVALWIGFLPQPYDLSVFVALLLPAIAYVISIPLNGRWNFVETRAGDQRPGVAFLYAGPTFALVLRLFDYRIVDHARLLLLGCIFGIVAWVLLNLLRRTERWLSLGQMALLFMIGLYGWTGATMLNVRLHYIKRDVALVEILASENDGEDASITLAPWGPYTNTYSADIPARVQAQMPVGATVNIYMYTGILGARWWVIGIPPRSKS